MVPLIGGLVQVGICASTAMSLDGKVISCNFHIELQGALGLKPVLEMMSWSRLSHPYGALHDVIDQFHLK